MEETRRQEARRARMTARRTSSLRLDAAAEMIGHSCLRPNGSAAPLADGGGDPFAAGCAVSLCHVGVGRDAAFEVCCITGATS